MYPIPTLESRIIGVVAVLAMAFGTVLSAPLAVALGGAVLLVIAFAFALTAPIARRARTESLEFAWWVMTETKGERPVARAGAEATIGCFFRHRGAKPFTLRGLRAVSAVAYSRTRERDVLVLGGASRTDFTLEVEVATPGRAVLHGVAARLVGPLGLFEMPLYFPNRLRLTVMPRAARAIRREPPIDGKLVPRKTAVRRRGAGADLHELRELRPGDPYRMIAWKTSARLGRLVVKEVEQEEHGTHRILVDASPSMRRGDPGTTRFDRALELALAISQASLARGDRVGVSVLDGRALAHASPDDRADQQKRIVDTLLTATQVVDEDRTDIDDVEVARSVARYLRHQDGVDFLDPSEPEGVHMDALASHVESALRGPNRVFARTHAGRALRRYCQHVGLPLPYRLHASAAEKTAGLVEACAAIERRRRAASQVTIVTDLEGVVIDGPLALALGRLRAHGHAVDFVLIPDGSRRLEGGAIDERLARERRDREANRLRTSVARLARVGVKASVDNWSTDGSPRMESETAA